MLVRLALETRSYHARADADRLALLEDATPGKYRAFLGRVLGFEGRYEEALRRTPGLDPQVVRTRAKADRIAVDLAALGMTEREIAALPRCNSIPSVFRTIAQALGWMYVVERNTLLHGLLRRHLEMHLPPELERAGSYLGAYGDTPGARYRELGELLGTAARGSVMPNHVVSAANDAFRHQRSWFTAPERNEHAPVTPLAS
jgi:heme oxygenase